LVRVSAAVLVLLTEPRTVVRVAAADGVAVAVATAAGRSVAFDKWRVLAREDRHGAEAAQGDRGGESAEDHRGGDERPGVSTRCGGHAE